MVFTLTIGRGGLEPTLRTKVHCGNRSSALPSFSSGMTGLDAAVADHVNADALEADAGGEGRDSAAQGTAADDVIVYLAVLSVRDNQPSRSRSITQPTRPLSLGLAHCS